MRLPPLELPRVVLPLVGAARRRRPRADAPRTILPGADRAGSPAGAAPEPFASRVDAARSRLRAAIPPVADDD